MQRIVKLLESAIFALYNAHVGFLQESVLLHPIRMRVVLVVGSQELSTKEIHAQMPDVAQATLYRSIKRLVASGHLEIAGYRHSGGVAERVYRRAVPTGIDSVEHREIVQLNAQEIQRLTANFAAALNNVGAMGVDGIVGEASAGRAGVDGIVGGAGVPGSARGDSVAGGAGTAGVTVAVSYSVIPALIPTPTPGLASPLPLASDQLEQ